jgi:hypothetical protein
MHEVTITVGAMLTKVLGRHLWMAYIEPAISALDCLQREHPLNPSALGFKESQ